MPRAVDRLIRDHVRYTGDGLPGEPVNAPLPIGDPASGVYNPTKKDIRDAIGDVEGDRIRAEAASELARTAMVDAQGATLQAASLSALLANTASYPVGTIFATRAEGYSFEVVAAGTAADHVTAGGVRLRAAEVAPITIHVAPSGSDTGRGFSAASPLASLAEAFRRIRRYGIARGSWTIQLAAGTYTLTEGAVLSDVLSSARLVVRGPEVGGHPNVPTAILNGAGLGAHAITLNGAYATIQDIKIINMTGGASTGGIVAQSKSDLYTKNVHIDGATWFGIYGTSQSQIRVEGGIIENCRENIALNDAAGSVGYNATSFAQGPIIRSATEKGVYWSRGSQGHVDYVTFEDNVCALFVAQNARVHDMVCDYRRNGCAIRTRTGGIVSTDRAEFNVGTANANGLIFDTGAYSGINDILLDQTGAGFAADPHSEVLIGRDLNQYSTGSATTVRNLVTPCIIRAPLFVDNARHNVQGPKLRINLSGSKTGTAGGSRVKVLLGGTEVVSLDLFGATSADWTAVVEIWATGANSQLCVATLNGITAGVQSTRHFPAFSRAINATVDLPLTIAAQSDNAADAVILKTCEVWLTA